MHPRSRHLVLVATMALVSAAALPGSVAADPARKVQYGADRGHDVQSIAFDPRPCGTAIESRDRQETTTDITDLSATHDSVGVHVTVGYEDLQHRDQQTTEVRIETAGRDYVVHVSLVDLGEGDQPSGSLDLAPVPPDPDDLGACGAYFYASISLPCDDLAVDIDVTGDVVTADVPRSCLGRPRWVRVGAKTYRFGNQRNYYDTWVPVGATGGGREQPVGPKLRIS